MKFPRNGLVFRSILAVVQVLAIFNSGVCRAEESPGAASTNQSTSGVASLSATNGISTEARALLEKVAKAYEAIESVELNGTLSVNVEVGAQKQATDRTFTSAYQDPNQFKHVTQNQIQIGSSGEKSYIFDISANAYLLSDPIPAQPKMADLPGPIVQTLQMQNPSLLFLISRNPIDDLMKDARRIERSEDLLEGDQKLPALKFVSEQSPGDIQFIIDPKTHLLRRIVVDMREALQEQQSETVTTARLVVDYTSIKPGQKFEKGYFDWAPPKDAKDVAKAAAESQRDDPAERLTGKEAPNFTLENLEGSKVALADMKGKVVVLDFWATWCGPCVKSLPHLDEIYKSKGGDKVQVFAVNLRENRNKVQGFLKDRKIALPVLMDVDGKVADLYLVQSIPQTVIIGKDGKIRKVFVGAGPDLSKNIRKEIEEAQQEG